MRLILVGDVHLSDRPPSIRTDQYSAQVLAKVGHAVRIANDHKADAIVFAGDVFHIKTPSRTSHALVQATHQVLTSDNNIPVLVVPGNHDMQHDRIDSLPQQPLGTLCRMEGVEMLMGWHDQLPIFGLPFLNDYPRELPHWSRLWFDGPRFGEVVDSLMVTHAPLFPPGQLVPYEFIDASEWAERVMGETGCCYYGHIHDVHGTYEVNDVRFCNQGALSRGSLHEGTLKRKPAVTLFEDGTFTRIEVPHKPAAEVFRLSEKAVADDQQSKLDEFLDSVENTVLDGLSVEAVLAHVKSLDLKPGTREEIESCLETALSE